jgi:flavin-dependent dehydrogenase
MRDDAQFDLVVIGAGPAGTATAITAARLGAKVALCEAGQFPRQKVCGEFVSAESLHILGDLLRELPEAETRLASAPVIGETQLWFRGRSIRADVDPPGLSIPRYELDCILWRAAQKAGVCTLENCEVRSVEGRGPFSITADRTMSATAVVVAAGRWSKFRPQVAVPPGPKWLGIKAHFREKAPALSTDLYFFEGGYCGVQPVGENLVNACALVRSDQATNLPEVFALDPTLAGRADSWQQVTKPVSTSPLFYREPTPTSGNLIFVGDAAVFIDPFVGDGISIALRTGVLAGTGLQRVFKGDASVATVVEEYGSDYRQQFAASITTASRIRKLMFWPRPLQIAVFELLRTPGVVSHFIRRTRRTTAAD